MGLFDRLHFRLCGGGRDIRINLLGSSAKSYWLVGTRVDWNATIFQFPFCFTHTSVVRKSPLYGFPPTVPVEEANLTTTAVSPMTLIFWSCASTVAHFRLPVLTLSISCALFTSLPLL